MSMRSNVVSHLPDESVGHASSFEERNFRDIKILISMLLESLFIIILQMEVGRSSMTIRICVISDFRCHGG